MQDQSTNNTGSMPSAKDCAGTIENAIAVLRLGKPNDRSEKDRYWAIVITDLEKSLAVFKTYISN